MWCANLAPICLGHGGARAAEYVKHHLFTNLISHPKFISDTKLAIGMFLLMILFYVIWTVQQVHP